MRKIAVIVGSKSDLSQCGPGLELLKEAQESKDVEVVGLYVRSQHRNTLDTQQLLSELVKKEVDVAIVGAGWANHLTGCCDAFLRYTLKNDKLVIVGVAFFDPDNQNHTKAAILSMTEVPGTQVVYKEDGEVFIGISGFVSACSFAVYCELPKIELKEPKPIMDLTVEEALEVVNK